MKKTIINPSILLVLAFMLIAGCVSTGKTEGYDPQSGVIRVAPVYPTRAAARGTEGYVIVSFTVDEHGNVQDPKVVEGVPKGIFDSAMLKAVKQWTYKPKIENGKPVAVEDVQAAHYFRLGR